MFANFGRYLRFIARRERIVSTIWIAAMVSFSALLAAMYPGLFPTKEALVNMSATLSTPAMVAMMGPVYGLDQISPAIAMAQECLLWFAIAAAVMNIFFVNRHTRADEELGRHEMLASLPLGRLAGSLATIKAAFVLNATISLLTALSLVLIDIPGTTAAGAFAYALSIGAQGLLFAALTLLTAQLFSTARGSAGASFALLGLFYLLRASGDMSQNALSAISPMGLGLRVEAFYTNNFVPILALLAETVVLAGLALAVNARRDVGAGVFPAKKGRAHASRFLQSPFGLAWRLCRGGFLAWAIAFFVLGAMYGTVIGELDTFVEGNETVRKLLEGQGGAGSLAEAFLPMLCGIMALVTSISVVGTVNRLRAEEKRGRMEQIYARSVSKSAMFASFAAIAAAEAVVFTLLSVSGLYATSQGARLLSFGAILGAAFVYVPAILVLAGLAALLVGLLPRFTALVWALFGYSFLMLYFGRLFDVPEWAARLSPFGNVPQLPVQEFTVVPLLVLSLFAVAAAFIGYLAGYRRRDIGV